MGSRGRHLELSGVRVRLGSFELGPVDLTLPPGVTSLLGANGAGKTTLIRLVIGVLKPAEGTIRWRATAPPDRAGEPGYLPQDFSGPKNVRVRDYLRFVAWARSRRGHLVGDPEVEQALAAVGLQDRGRQKFGELSGGMVRRVGIAQALVGCNDLLVLDEPTVGLDPVQRRDLRELVRGLGADKTVILSTHLCEDVAAIADRVVVLDEGTIRHEGTVETLVAAGGQGERSGDSVERGFIAVLEGARR